MAQFSPIITGSLPRHANEAVWRQVHKLMTLPWEGGFKDETGRGTDELVTLFGITHLSYARATGLRPEEAKEVLRNLSRYANPDGTTRTTILSADGKTKIPTPEPIIARLQDLREHSFEMFRDTYLRGAGFDKLKHPLLQGITADTSYHLGEGRAYKALAMAAGMDVRSITDSSAWRESVITRVNNMITDEASAARFIGLLGQAKQEIHLDILAAREAKLAATSPTDPNHAKLKTAVENMLLWQEGFTNRIYDGFPAMYAALNPDAPRLEIPQPDRQRGGLPALTALRLERIGGHLDARRISRITVADPDPDHGVRPVTISVAGLPNVKGILHCLIADHDAAVVSQERGDGGTLKLASEDVGACGIDEIAAKQLADKVLADAARPPAHPKAKATKAKATAR